MLIGGTRCAVEMQTAQISWNFSAQVNKFLVRSAVKGLMGSRFQFPRFSFCFPNVVALGAET